MPPSNRLKCSPGIGDEDSLVADAAKVPRAIPPEGFDDFVRSAAAHKGGDRAIGPLLVPRLHGGVEFVSRLFGRRQRAFELGHPEIALRDVLRLRFLELIEGPEERQQPVLGDRVQAHLIRRMDRQNTVEFETGRMRIDVADAGQKEGGQKIAVRQPALEFGDHHLEALLTGSPLDQADDRLDVGRQANQFGRHLGLVLRRGASAASAPGVTQPKIIPAPADDLRKSRRVGIVPLLRESAKNEGLRLGVSKSEFRRLDLKSQSSAGRRRDSPRRDRRLLPDAAAGLACFRFGLSQPRGHWRSTLTLVSARKKPARINSSLSSDPSQ